MKQETLEKAAEEFYEGNTPNITFLMMAQFGAKWQAEKMYSEKEVLQILFELSCSSGPVKVEVEEWFQQFKK